MRRPVQPTAPSISRPDAYRPRLTRGAAPAVVASVAGVGLLLLSTLLLRGEVDRAADRLAHPAAATSATQVAIADNTEAPYCTPSFKAVLQRVLTSCGLVGGEARRGCRPNDVKTFAQISGSDFNELFTPLRERGAVLLFDEGVETLDSQAMAVLEDKWNERKGARYFFVVARASKTGTPDANRTLSHKRANSVLFHLNERFHDPDLDRQVGLMWLGNEFAQLDKTYCEWPTSRQGKTCNADAINRSAFISWVDCRL